MPLYIDGIPVDVHQPVVDDSIYSSKCFVPDVTRAKVICPGLAIPLSYIGSSSLLPLLELGLFVDKLPLISPNKH
jgi:hypothetical protein